MKSDIFATLLILAMLLTTCCANDSPVFKITPTQTEDGIEVKSEDDRVVLVVRSPSGIGDATIERITELWPDKVVIRLQLSGLENFKVSTDELSLEASISSHSGTVRLWKNGEDDAPLNRKSPYWTDIRLLDRNGKPARAIPVKDGCFEMQLPKKFFVGNPTVIRLAWIDFYRN